MPRPVYSALALALVAVAACVAGCGSGDPPTDQSVSASAISQPSTPAATASPAATATTSQRAKVHAYAARMMADIAAAEDRGDLIDGVPVGQSDSPYDYVGISPMFTKLVGLGETALPAIAAEIEASNKDGLREYLLAAAGAQISGDVPGGDQSWSTGKEWARQYRQQH